MSNRNYGSRLAHGFYLQCQVGAGATVNKCSYLRCPAPALWNTHRQLPDRLQPGCAPKAWLCQPPKGQRGSSGGTGIASHGSGHKRDGSKTHPPGRKEQCVWSPCGHDTTKFKVACQGPQVRVRHHILTWDAHWVCTRKTSKSQDSLRPSGENTSEGSGWLESTGAAGMSDELFTEHVLCARLCCAEGFAHNLPTPLWRQK